MQKFQYDSKRWFLESSARFPVLNSFYLSYILMKNGGDRTVWNEKMELEQFRTHNILICLQVLAFI